MPAPETAIPGGIRLAMRRSALALALAAILALGADPGFGRNTGFAFTFDWSDLPRCTSGHPGAVPSPAFRLQAVPTATRFIRFTLHDRDAPAFRHGGGTVPYRGRAVIAAGAFSYLQPCPPDGPHRYRWKAAALAADGITVLARASADRVYPP